MWNSFTTLLSLAYATRRGTCVGCVHSACDMAVLKLKIVSGIHPCDANLTQRRNQRWLRWLLRKSSRWPSGHRAMCNSYERLSPLLCCCEVASCGSLGQAPPICADSLLMIAEKTSSRRVGCYDPGLAYQTGLPSPSATRARRLTGAVRCWRSGTSSWPIGECLHLFSKH